MSANVRFIFNNAADRATITATTTAGSMVPANMQTDERAAVWRSTADSAQTLLLSWTAAEIIDSVCMAWTNLTALATVRIKGYTLAADYPASPEFDETFSPDSALALGEFVWGVDPLVESGAQRARLSAQVQCWLAASHLVRKLEIIITDASNALDYIEVSRLVVGEKISPSYTAEAQGFSVGWVERTRPVRAESGDLRVDPMGRFRRSKLPLEFLDAASRNAILGMIASGLGRGVWVSALPEDAEASNQQLCAFWGALVQDSEFALPLPDFWATPLVFEEMA